MHLVQSFVYTLRRTSSLHCILYFQRRVKGGLKVNVNKVFIMFLFQNFKFDCCKHIFPKGPTHPYTFLFFISRPAPPPRVSNGIALAEMKVDEVEWANFTESVAKMICCIAICAHRDGLSVIEFTIVSSYITFCNFHNSTLSSYWTTLAYKQQITVPTQTLSILVINRGEVTAYLHIHSTCFYFTLYVYWIYNYT